MITKVNLANKFSLFSDHWHPRIVGELNDSYVKLAKLSGDFVWHKHDDEDEMFFVIEGSLIIRLQDQDIAVETGEFVIIPKGVEHFPIAEKEVHVLLIEPKSTLHTANVVSDKTVTTHDWI